MPITRVDRDARQIVMHTSGAICTTTQEVVESEAFAAIVAAYVARLRAHRSPLLEELGVPGLAAGGEAVQALVDLLRLLANNPFERVTAAGRSAADGGRRGAASLPSGGARSGYVAGTETAPDAGAAGTETAPDAGAAGAETGADSRQAGGAKSAAAGSGTGALAAGPGEAAPDRRREALHEFVEGLYDYWRAFDRFMVAHEEGGGTAAVHRPHRDFNQTMEAFATLVRGLYRDVVENITGDHPRVYRQVSAGCEVGLVCGRREWPVPAAYRAALSGVPFVRHVVIDPPFIIDPPTNKRTGQFVEVPDNPITGLELDPARWICYPAVVGHAVVFVYVNQRFIGLGSALANLFELADEAQIAAGPDAVYLFGVPPESLSRYGELPTVFYDDTEADLLVGAVPAEDRFGYFGYLKKMALTLHNVAAMKRGRMPYHGACTRIVLKSGAAANVLIIGDTATGKSETLEALRQLAGDEIADLRIVADDMGTLELGGDGAVRAYGTEVGAFVRLDDLSKGYAFGQLDRAIFMSPQKTNARVVVPVTTLEEVQHAHRVDVLLYANNYEWVDESHQVIERFADAEAALAVFREGRAMSKGTTTATGLTSTYFANIFGAAQRRERHEEIAARVFAAAYASGAFVGQLRTQLGIEGFESKGPQEAAVALLRLIATRTQQGG